MSSIEEIGPILDEYETNVYIYQNETIELQNESSDVISPCEKYLDLMDYNLSIGKNLSIIFNLRIAFMLILNVDIFCRIRYVQIPRTLYGSKKTMGRSLFDTIDHNPLHHVLHRNNRKRFR